MTPVRNILFDFGNVLFDIDLSRIESGFKHLFGEHSASARETLQKQRIFELYETGGISTDEFLDALVRASGQEHITPEAVKQVWNSIFIGMPTHRFDMLMRLREHHQVFLLSNINDLHERWIADYMSREHGINDYENKYFDGIYFSHLIRLRKPDREYFEYVLADAELKPEECIFFDDLTINVEGARMAGIQGFVHDPRQEIETMVTQIIAAIQV